MRVEFVELRRVQIPMKRAFKHALHERKHTDAVFVALGAEGGEVGWGEILPRPYVTGETIEQVLDEIGPAWAARVLGLELTSMAEARAWLEDAAGLAGQRLATLCGFDLALLDLAGKALASPVAAVLGGVKRPPLPAGVIIGFETKTEKVARYCATLRLAGRKHIKVKVGLPDDLERLQLIAKVFKDTPLRLDANAAWSVDEAVERLSAMKQAVPIASVEQPIAADDLAGLRRIRQETGLRVMADESVCSLRDAEALIEARAADIFNVRLGKNGGLVASHRLVQRAEQAGIAVHLGTMVGESGVLSVASEIFGQCVGGFDCLDGKGQNAFLLEVDIVRDSGQHPLDPTSAGLGVAVSLPQLQPHQVGETRRFSRS